MSVSALVSVGVQAMQASTAQLQTTSHNIANASVEGYSRQTVSLETARSRFTGSGFFGLGVNVSTTNRAHDAFLTRESATAAAQAAQDATRSEQLSRLESVFPIGESGLGYVSSQFLNAMIDVAAKPSDSSAREVVLARGRDLAAAFTSAAGQLDALQRGLTQDLETSVSNVNELARRLAQTNQQIASAEGSGHSPNDLMDQRDGLVGQLSKFMQVSTVMAPDGTMGVFIAGGQKLVLGTEASELRVIPDPTDASRSALAMVEGKSLRDLPPSLLAGGSLSGLLRFQSEDLNTAANLIGRMARAVADRVNQQQSLGLDLFGAGGKAVFSIGEPRVLKMPGNQSATADPVVTIVDAKLLQPSDYELRVDSANPGRYVVTRLSDSKSWDAVASGDTIDGFRITTPAPAPSGGDRFILQPVAKAAAGMGMVLSRPEEFAAASPVVAAMSASNRGTLSFTSLSSLVPVTAAPAPISITFQAPAASGASVPYQWTQGGVTQTGTWTTGQPLVVDGKYSLNLLGVPVAGDQLTLSPTLNPGANNGNAMAFSTLRDEGFVGGNTVTEAYAGMVGDIGVRVQGANTASRISTSVAAAAEQRRSSASGVNLDEEAANLVHQQQQYQAAAKVLQVAQSVFDTLLQVAAR